VALLLIFTFESTAQTVKVKRVAKSPGILKLNSSTSTTWQIYSGLRTVGKGMKVYLLADTTGSGSTLANTFDWTFVEKPTGSTTNFDSTNKIGTTFTADFVGKYIVKVTVNGTKTHQDTLWASTYAGNPTTGLSCSTCHASTNTTYQMTNHATIYKRGITGQLEVGSYGTGTYSGFCVKCHTTAWEKNVNNGNFGYLSYTTGWDTTWYKPAAGPNNVAIPYMDTTRWVLLNNSYPTLKPVATIGCESCHGPGVDHKNGGDKTKISKSVDAGVCLQCHDAPSKHMLGSMWMESHHATMPLSGSRSATTSCWPCHNGEAFVRYASNKPSPNYTGIGAFPSIACATCHDPHDDTNPYQLRTVRLDSLQNGYKFPAAYGGIGQLCMNCHRARENSVKRIASQELVFANRFYPHYSPQADMFLGANTEQFGLNITGLSTHKGLEKGCITCHMQERTIGIAKHSNHGMNMLGQDSIMIKACRNCHGSWINTYNDVLAGADYDGNGQIQGVQTEITNLMNNLKATLPLNSTTGEPCTENSDSAKVRNHPKWPQNLKGIWTYYFVKNDWSKGIHNTKYAAAILKGALSLMTGVKMENLEIPKSFSVSQNYPNPFNPTTEVRFSVPRNSKVTLQIYNSIGKLVKTLTDDNLSSGNYSVKWNSDDNFGNKVASGVYFYRFVATSVGQPNYVVTKKMLLVK
jgi:hypothetical protein